MKRRFMFCFSIIAAALLLLGSMPVSAVSGDGSVPTVLAANTSTAAKKPAAPKTPVIPEIQTQYSNVLIQLEIMPKPVKGSPKLSDKIKLTDYASYVNKAMCEVVMAVDPKSKPKVNAITFLDAEKALLKALGYESELEGNTEKEILARAAELGLSANIAATAGKQITRGEAAVLIYNALTVPFAYAGEEEVPPEKDETPAAEE